MDSKETFYGGNKTFHRTGEVDVELHNGKVVAVWFRCLPLPFTWTNVEESRAKASQGIYPLNYKITGVTTSD